jgi:hypothetical protein
MTTPRVPIPKEVIDALEGGDLIEAIKRLRKSGLGLAEAKSALEAYARSLPERASDPRKPEPSHSFETPRNQPPPLLPRAGGLAPGEVPRSNTGLWIVLAAVAALVAYYYFSG